MPRDEVQPGFIERWCLELLGSGVERTLFTSGYLSQVTGLLLHDGRRVVVKVRPWLDRLEACSAVHQHLFEVGYPCPEPLVGLSRVGGWAVSAEALVQDAVPMTDVADAAGLFAEGLASLVRLAPAPGTVGTLWPAPPWADWHGCGRSELWPEPDDRAADLNAAPTTWIDEVAEVARRRLLAGGTEPDVLGHLDWYGANLSWRGRRLAAVFDWDSVGRQPESLVAGLASALWSGGDRWGSPPTVDQSQDFLSAYAESRGRPWTSTELQHAWLAGLWSRCFDAKKAQASGEDPRGFLTEEQAESRLARADAAETSVQHPRPR